MLGTVPLSGVGTGSRQGATAADRASLWYVAYGSNMAAARLGCYLAGGTPPGGRRSYPGCRDTRAPRRSVPVLLPGGIYFALESLAWTGGLALYDPLLTGVAPARAYLITAAQFADLLTQEMYREQRPDVAVLDEAIRRGRARLGPGRYETLVYVGQRDGHPMLTFTAPWRAGDVAFNAPAPAYLAMLAGGLHEAHDWSAARITAYLGGRPGVRDRWRRADLAAVVRDAVPR